MLTWNMQNSFPCGASRMYKEGACLSTDGKPTNVANGSKLFEMDTAILYIFDQENETWRAWE